MKHIMTLFTALLLAPLVGLYAAEPNAPQPKRPQEPKRPFPRRLRP
ncbi:MAG: hypothetical protein ACOYMN_23650 [Roseimicrobium sp.]